VLVVHEDSALLVYYRHVLEELGLEVFTAGTYPAGLACLDQETFGLVVVSEGSRSFEGRRILEWALEDARRTPVLVVTRCHDLSRYLDAMQLGAVDYLEEPIRVAEMERVVTTHLRASRSAA
jgi:DNA-binding response OmpR family regulator